MLISCLILGYVPIKNLFETGPWFLRTFPIKEESSTEFSRVARDAAIHKASICNALDVGACNTSTVCPKGVPGSRAKKILCDFS